MSLLPFHWSHISKLGSLSQSYWILELAVIDLSKLLCNDGSFWKEYSYDAVYLTDKAGEEKSIRSGTKRST
jgi:hypothetical protein